MHYDGIETFDYKVSYCFLTEDILKNKIKYMKYYEKLKVRSMTMKTTKHQGHIITSLILK